MRVLLGFLVCVFSLCSCGKVDASEIRKNLELKIELDETSWEFLKKELSPFYSETLEQKDTYFVTREGRLKLREEKGKQAYFVRYTRPNVEHAKQSEYCFYFVEDAGNLLSVLGDSLRKELVVKKQRELYFPEPHIRVHLDRVEKLGNFLEIEIILSNDVSLELAKVQMEELENRLKLKKLPRVLLGYRELLQQKDMQLSANRKDLAYYKAQNKVFWVIAEDHPVANFKRYDVIPCIFVEVFEDGSYGIIQLDPSIANDSYCYTAWRKLIGQEKGFRADVLLIDVETDKLYTLEGKEIPFEHVGRSMRYIDKSYLAPFANSFA